MKLEDIIKFDPIDLTQIILYSITLFSIILIFRSQLDSFFESLTSRPITVTMDGSQTSIKLDAPVKPEFFTAGLTDRSATADGNENWGENLQYVHDIEGLRKMGFDQLYRDIESLDDNQIAVLNYEVNDPGRPYFQDQNMLRYLSIASEKIRYLAFYENSQFVGYIKIEKVIKGLASGDNEFINFGDRLKSNDWKRFPGLVKADQAFTEIPTIKELFERLNSSKLTEIPLVQNGKLSSILTYETVSNALYLQTSSNEKPQTSI